MHMASNNIKSPNLSMQQHKVTYKYSGVTGGAIRHWTMMTQEPGVYIMTKEQKSIIPVKISMMGDELISFIKVHLNLTESLKESLNSIEELRKDHRKQVQELMINNKEDSGSGVLLSSIVNLITIRLNESKHAKEVVDSPRSGSSSLQR